HWSEILDWLAVNGFWLSLATAGTIGAAVALWVYVILQPGKGFVPPDATAAERREALADRAHAAAVGITNLIAENPLPSNRSREFTALMRVDSKQAFDFQSDKMDQIMEGVM